MGDTGPGSKTCSSMHPNHMSPSSPLDSWKYRLQAKFTVNQSPQPLKRHPRHFGVLLNTQLAFTSYIQTIVEKASDRLKAVKVLTGATWGHQKETSIFTYKAVAWSIPTYAVPFCSSITSPNNIKKLQTIQNSTLRITTGSQKRASLDHLHSETQMLTIEDILRLLYNRYLFSGCPLSQALISYIIYSRVWMPYPKKNTPPIKLSRVRDSISHGQFHHDR